MKDLMTSREVATYLGMTIHAVNMRRRTGQLPFVKVGAVFLFRRRDVEAAKPRQTGGRQPAA
jgi:excisionase family DNA binding protein